VPDILPRRIICSMPNLSSCHNYAERAGGVVCVCVGAGGVSTREESNQTTSHT